MNSFKERVIVKTKKDATLPDGKACNLLIVTSECVQLFSDLY